MRNGVVIGIDTGSSSTKLSLFDVAGNCLRENSFKMDIYHPTLEQAEIDLKVLFANIIHSLKELVTGYEKDVRGIGLSVASPTLVLFDHEYKPIRRGIAYFDNRSIKEVDQAMERFGGGNMYFARVGNNPSPSTCVAATINWVRDHEPDVWGKVAKIGFLNSYLGVELTGNLAVEPTVSSYSGLLRIRKAFSWEPKFFDIFNLDLDLMPDIITPFEKLGGLKKSVAAAIGIPEGIPVAIGAADTAASSLAMGIRKHGDVFQSMGTSEVAVFCLNNPNFSPSFMNRSHVIPGLWLSNGAMSMAGGSIRWILENIFTDVKSEAELEQMAQASAPGANGVIYLPYICGERSPMFDSKAEGVFFGLTSTTRREDMARAVYEGIAFAMQQIYKMGTNRWEVRPKQIICIGGATKSKLSLQLRANMQNVKIFTVDNANAATFGAGMMGALAGGLYEGIAALPIIDNYKSCIKPDPEVVQFYIKYQEIYQQLYPCLKECMHKLYDLEHGDL